VLIFAVAAVVVIIDQASKRLIWEAFKDNGGMDLVDGILRIRLSTNTGAVMGILSGSRPILISVTIISIIALIYFAYRMRYAPVLKRLCLGLVLGGAFGNLIDRIATGKVVDFVDMGIGSLRWPTYNAADIAVTVGAVILVAGFAFQKEQALEGPPPRLPAEGREDGHNGPVS
jgi:signal peptidase II